MRVGARLAVTSRPRKPAATDGPRVNVVRPGHVAAYRHRPWPAWICVGRIRSSTWTLPRRPTAPMRQSGDCCGIWAYRRQAVDRVAGRATRREAGQRQRATRRSHDSGTGAAAGPRRGRRNQRGNPVRGRFHRVHRPHRRPASRPRDRGRCPEMEWLSALNHRYARWCKYALRVCPRGDLNPHVVHTCII